MDKLTCENAEKRSSVECAECGSTEDETQRCSDCPRRVPRWYTSNPKGMTEAQRLAFRKFVQDDAFGAPSLEESTPVRS